MRTIDRRWYWTPYALGVLAALLAALMGWHSFLIGTAYGAIWRAFRAPCRNLARVERDYGDDEARKRFGRRLFVAAVYFAACLSIRFARIGSTEDFQSKRIVESFLTPTIWLGGFLLVRMLFKERVYTPFTIHHRGNRLIEQAAVRAAADRERGEAPGLCWAGVEYPAATASRHFLAVGVTGSGKSTMLDILLASLFRAHRREPFRVVLFDAKSEAAPKLYGLPLRAPPVLMNPFDRRAAAWDVAADAEDSATVLQFANILIPDLGNESQPFFGQSARLLLMGVMRAFALTSPKRWTFRDVLLACDSAAVLRTVLERHPTTARLVRQFFEPKQTLQNILSTMASRLVQFEPIAAAWTHAAERLSLRAWLRSERILVLGFDDTRKAALQAINRLLLQRLTELLLANPRPYGRTWVMLDEAREIGKVEGLEGLLTRGRSLGCSVVLGIQDVEGFRLALDEKRAHEILSQCGIKTFLRVDGVQTAEWASKSFGELEEWQYTYAMNEVKSVARGPGSQTTTGKGVTQNEALVKRDVVLPSEFLGLPLGDWTNGIEGYTAAAGWGTFRSRMSAEHIVRRSVLPNLAVPRFAARPAPELELTSWTADDLRRLNLPMELLQAARSPTSMRRTSRRA